MNSANAQWFSCIPPQVLVNGSAWTSNVIDTRDFAYCEILVQLGALDAALTVLKVQEADVGSGSTLTNGADVTGLVFGTSVGSALSASTLPAATADNNLYALNIDLKGRKRYLQIQATIASGSAGGYLAALARLSRDAVNPSDTTGFGCAQVLQSPPFAT